MRYRDLRGGWLFSSPSVVWVVVFINVGISEDVLVLDDRKESGAVVEVFVQLIHFATVAKVHLLDLAEV